MAQPRKRWSELGPAQRAMAIAGAIVQVTLLVLAQRDLSRRSAEEIRGSRGLWRAATFVNFVGPIAYFAFGRKRTTI